MASTFSYIKSQRGKDKLIFDGYIYKQDRSRNEKTYWVCHLPDCKGRCIQKNDEITTTLEHNHSPDAAAIEVNCLHVLSFLMPMLYIVREIFHNCQLCLSLWMCIESYILNRKRNSY